MPELAVVLAASALTSSVLTLVIPVGVLIVIAVWYVILFRGGAGER